MKIGDARVPTADQHLELQLNALEEAGCTRFSNKKYQAPNVLHELERLREYLLCKLHRFPCHKSTVLINSWGYARELYSILVQFNVICYDADFRRRQDP